MNWKTLNSDTVLQEIDTLSAQQKVLIFKHSTRCSISSTALGRLQRQWDGQKASHLAPYLLDLIGYRQLSNSIAERYGVRHESPQVLVIEQGKCVFHASHLDISFADIVNN